MWWRTRDSLSHVSQLSDFWQNQGVSQISPLFLDLNGSLKLFRYIKLQFKPFVKDICVLCLIGNSHFAAMGWSALFGRSYGFFFQKIFQNEIWSFTLMVFAIPISLSSNNKIQQETLVGKNCYSTVNFWSLVLAIFVTGSLLMLWLLYCPVILLKCTA